MRRLRTLLVIAILSLCTSVMGQKIDGYYVSRPESGYMIYFLMPQELMMDQQKRELSYDLTILRGEGYDTTRMNFTYYDDEATQIDSVRLESRRVSIGARCERLFIEPEKDRWAHRYSFVAPLAEYYPLYDAESPATITLYRDGKELFRYEARKKEWEKYAPIGAKILGMIRLR